MNHKDHYDRWVQTRRRVEMHPDFADRVMSHLQRPHHRANRSFLARARLLQRIAVSSWAKAAALGIATIIGIARLLLTLHVLLFA